MATTQMGYAGASISPKPVDCMRTRIEESLGALQAAHEIITQIEGSLHGPEPSAVTSGARKEGRDIEALLDLQLQGIASLRDRLARLSSRIG